MMCASRRRTPVGIWTDGSTWPHNPGNGGCAAALVYQGDGILIAGHFPAATNNYMESLAVLKALERLVVPCQVELFTDSQYVYHGLRRICKGEILKTHTELWREMAAVIKTGRHIILPFWVRGHAGDAYNCLVDYFAGVASHNLTSCELSLADAIAEKMDYKKARKVE